MEMALAMNPGVFEGSFGNVIQGPWTSLSDDELFCVDGGVRHRCRRMYNCWRGLPLAYPGADRPY